MGAWWLEKLFRFLFKYPPLMFQQGDFTWGLSRPVLLASRAAAAIAVLALLTYRGVSATDRPRDRVDSGRAAPRRARGPPVLPVPARR